MSAKYVQRRVEDQLLAREWYKSRGCSLHSAGSRLLHNYLPRDSDMKQFRREKLAKNASMSVCSNDSGVDTEGDFPSLETLDLRESYVEIDVTPDSLEVVSREIHPSRVFAQHCTSFSLDSTRVFSMSTPTTPATAHSHNASLPIPITTENLAICSTPGLPYARSHNSSTASLCSCHAFQVVTVDCSRPDSWGRQPGLAGNSPQLNHNTRCCSRCEGHCRIVADMDDL